MRERSYLNLNYLTKERWISYWYQIKESALLNKGPILEIGPGNKIVSDTLRKMRFEVKTLDTNPWVNPDFLGNVVELADLTGKNSFGTVLCCQVLEHLPYEEFPRALSNLNKVTMKYLILTLPYTSRGTFKPNLTVKPIPFLKAISWVAILNFFPKEFKFNGQHYWEIGAKGYRIGRILNDIKRSGFRIIKHYPIVENPYHYLIVCEKTE